MSQGGWEEGKRERAKDEGKGKESKRGSRLFLFPSSTARLLFSNFYPTEASAERERARVGEYVNGNTGLANTQEAFPFLSETSKPRWE